MVPEPRDDRARLVRHQRDEVRVGRRHALHPRARLAELLPDQQPEPVARRVEVWRLDQPAAPHAQQVDVRARGEAEKVRQLLRPRNAVQRVDRHPVPALDRHADAVDDERIVVQRDRPEADLEIARPVEALLAHAVRPPELRVVDAQDDLAADFDRADSILEPYLWEDLGLRIERHRAPDALVDHARAEVPAVAHSALVDANSARAPDLRLTVRSGVHDDREQVVAAVDLHLEGAEHALVRPGLLAVDEYRRRVVDAVEADAAPLAVHLDPPPVDPRALGRPFGEAAVAHPVRVGDLARAQQVVEHASGHAGGDPAGRGPRLVHVPLPLVAEATFQLPLLAVERPHNASRSVSVPSRNVLISAAPKSA